MFTSQAIWWDHLDLNQESTNYEFAALTNYAIVPHSTISISLSVTTATLAPQDKRVFSFSNSKKRGSIALPLYYILEQASKQISNA